MPTVRVGIAKGPNAVNSKTWVRAACESLPFTLRAQAPKPDGDEQRGGQR